MTTIWSMGHEPRHHCYASSFISIRLNTIAAIMASCERGGRYPPSDDLEFCAHDQRNDRTRRRVTSYAEVVLELPRDHDRHPAFNKLFVGSECAEMKGCSSCVARATGWLRR
jgi:hypothetical protein